MHFLIYNALVILFCVHVMLDCHSHYHVTMPTSLFLPLIQSLSEMETSLASSSHAAAETIPLTEESSMTNAAELTTLTVNGREALLSSITQAGIGELGGGGQFLLPSSGVDSNQSGRAGTAVEVYLNFP